MFLYPNEKIIVCHKCEGKGEIEHSEITDYHKNERSYWYTECTECEGSGMLIETTIKEYRPHTVRQHLEK